MASFRIGLIVGSSNYSFFDPDAGLNLSIGNPVGFANRITKKILRGLKFKTLVDIDGVIDLATGNFKTVQEIKEPVTPPADPNVEPPKSDATDASEVKEPEVPEVPANSEAPADSTPEAPVETSEVPEEKVEAPAEVVEAPAVVEGEDRKATKNTKKK
jgi:hypothetical protein